MRKQRHRAIKRLAQCPKARMSLSWALNLGSYMAASILLRTTLNYHITCVFYRINKNVYVKFMEFQAVSMATAIILLLLAEPTHSA